MTDSEVDKLVREYLRYLEWSRFPERLPATREEMQAIIAESDARHSMNPHIEASDDLSSLIYDEPKEAWTVIQKVAEACDERDLGMLGAGELETFVHVQAEAFADEIEQAIRISPRIRKAFESVYIGGDTPEHVGRRFNNALRELGVSEESIIDWWSHSGPPANSR